METDQQLTLEFADGSRVDEYRIRGSDLEFRVRRREVLKGRRSRRLLAPTVLIAGCGGTVPSDTLTPLQRQSVA